MGIHPTAIIEDGAVVGAGVEIGPHAVVYRDTRIGDGCRIGPQVVIHPHTELGPGCRVHAQAVLGDVPQDLGFDDAPSRLRIGANTVIREGVTAHRGTGKDTETVVGSECYLMAFSHVGHNCRVGDRVILVNGVLLAGHVEIGDGTVLSGLTTVHQFCRVGRLTITGGSSLINKDIPPFCMTRPGVLSTIVGLNTIGLRRAGVDAGDRKRLKAAFHEVFVRGRSPREAAETLLAEPDPPGIVAEFARFVVESRRGVGRYSDAG